MRVLLVHAYYQERGGEDVAFETDARLLAEAGHQIETLTFDNTAITSGGSLRDRLSLAANTVWSKQAAHRIQAAVTAHAPDVVHFHNTFPIISPAAFPAVRRLGVPVVATLHNYRLFCANANLYRQGAVCETCIGKPLPLPAVLHACYRDGRAESAVVAGMQVFHRTRRTWARDVDRFIAPSAFARAKFVQGGLPADRISVRSNAVSPAPLPPATERDGFLYVGRLAPNKGISTLLEAWETKDMPRLRIAGDGELAPDVLASAAANPNIEYLGPLPRDEVAAALRRSIALVVPSTWYEIQGLVILEAFSCGSPVIASNIGAIPEAVTDGETGLLSSPGDAAALARRIQWAAANPEAMATMGHKAFARFQQDFSPERSIAQLVAIYEAARADRRVQRGAAAHLETA